MQFRGSVSRLYLQEAGLRGSRERRVFQEKGMGRKSENSEEGRVLCTRKRESSRTEFYVYIGPSRGVWSLPSEDKVSAKVEGAVMQHKTYFC